MFSITLEINQRCNLDCTYCYLGEKAGERMSMETAYQGIDIAFQKVKAHKDNRLWFDFVGGEPLLDFAMIKKLVQYIEEINETRKCNLLLSLTTNGTIMNTEIMNYLIMKRFSIKISLDGVKAVNDMNRLSHTGYSVHDKIMEHLPYFHKYEEETHKYVQVTNVITRNNYMHYYESFLYLVEKVGLKVIDTAIDLNINWTEEEIGILENEIEKTLQFYLEQIKKGKSFVWSFFDSLRNVRNKCQKLFYCGAGIITLYLRTDGSMFPCPANLNKNAAIGKIETGYDNNKIMMMKNIVTIDNDDCNKCCYYDTCTGKGCIMCSLEKNNDINQPDPMLCREHKFMNELYNTYEDILGKISYKGSA